MPGPADWDAETIRAWGAVISGLLVVVGGGIGWTIKLLLGVHDQVTNSHDTNLRDDVDKVGAAVTGLTATVQALTETIEAERLERRRTDGAIREELDQLATTAKREHESLWQAIRRAISRAGEVDD